MVSSRIISDAKQSFGADLNIKGKAKDLRKNMTQHERILWNCIRKRQLNGMHFRRQHPYGIYILDFYCFEAQLVIEIDGMIHLKNREYDIERTEYLESSGLNVIRFKNEDVEERIEWVLKQIDTYLTKLPPL
jgi:very-short-patch-repair endonuclease